MIYTMVEPCAYFICSCLPGTRPLLRYIYRNSGIDKAFSQRKSTGSSTDDGGTAGNMPLGNLMGNHKVSISTSKATDNTRSSMENYRTGFIRLDETFDVHSSSKPNNQGGMV